MPAEPSSAADLLFLGYVLAFGAAALATGAGAWRAARISDRDTRRGLQALLLASSGWAAAFVGYLLAPGPSLQAGFYIAGFILGFGAVWAWIWLCSAYTGRTVHRNQAARRFAVGVFLLVTLTKLTNPWHGLYFSAEQVAVPFDHLAIDHRMLYWLSLGLSYALATAGYFMVFELLVEVRSGSGTLGVLFGLTALPGLLNVAGYASPALLNVSHEPLGVAIFALGILLLYPEEFEGTGLSGQTEEPALVLGESGRLQSYNKSATALFPELTRQKATGKPLQEVLPALVEALEEGAEIAQLGESEAPRYFRLTASRFGTGPQRSGQLLLLSDVTGREQYQRRLERDRRLLSEALEQAREPVLITEAEPLDPPGPSIVYVNEAFEKMTGYAEEEVLGETPRILQGPETEREVLDLLREALEAEEEWRGEAVNYKKDGSSYIVQWNVSPVFDEDGSIEHWVSVQRDVTEERRREETLQQERESAREALREREARLRGLANSVPGGIWQFEVLPDGTYTFSFVSDSFGELLGISPDPEGFLGRFVERIPSSHQEDLLATIDRTAEQENPFSYETPFIKPDGERIWLWGIATLERGETAEGKKLVYHGVTIDITQRKRAERDLERQNDLFRKAEDIANIGAWEYDVRREALTWTDEVYRIHGLSIGEEVDPEKAIGFYHPEDQDEIQSLFTRAVQEGEHYDTEVRLITAEGEQRWVRATGYPRTENGEIICVRGTFQDVTARKEREQALIEAKEEAERMNRLKSAFLANMSHEIRTPLTSILGFARAIGTEVEDAGELDLATLEKFSGLIQKSGERLLNTLDGVLNLSKLEAGEMDLELGPTDLSTEVKEAEEVFAPQAEEAGVELRAEVSRSPLWARANEEGVRIVLRNLISNGIKYTEEGGRVLVRAYPDGDGAALEVEDTGIGMDPEKASGLFEAFKQASEGIGREYEGSGLGLAVTKEVTEQMNGSIELDTEKGTGSRFTVRLPKAGPPSGQ